MHISRVFFKVSDILNHPLRNAVRYGKTEVVRNLRYGEGKRRRMESPLRLLPETQSSS